MSPDPHAPTLADGRYTLTRRLGEGGMAAVFLAWDNKLKVWRAIKVLLPSVALKAKLRKRFENEAHAMARLEHPNIVRVYDVGLEDNTIPYMVMELAEGGCIIDWLSRYGAMPPRLAVDVTVQLCKGIRAAHEAGIVHRDIKPHNILVNRKGVCKVTDFGIAQITANEDITKTGSVMGTWGFMAPEQRTDAKSIDQRADVFSIGATLYTLLTHRTPTEIYVAEPDDEIFDGIPPELLAVIVRACRYKPAERYPDAKSLALDVHKAGLTQPQVPPSTPSLALTTDPLPESVESAPLSPTVVTELNKALGRVPGTGGEATEPDEVSTDEPVPRPERKVLPYYMPSARPAGQTARAAGQIASAPPDRMPSYIDDVEYTRQNTEERVRAATPAPAPRPAPEVPGAPALVDQLLKFSIAPLVLVLLLLIGLGWGTFRVGSAADGFSASALELYRGLEKQSPVIDALQASGVERGPLDTLYFAFADAPPPDRPRAALAFVDAVERAAVSVTGASALDPAQPRIASLIKARDAFVASRTAWAEVAGAPPGSFAVALGLARPPPQLTGGPE